MAVGMRCEPRFGLAVPRGAWGACVGGLGNGAISLCVSVSRAVRKGNGFCRAVRVRVLSWRAAEQAVAAIAGLML